MKIIFSFLFAIVLTAGTFAQKPIFAEAKTNSATVYYNGAEMQQKASLSLPSGTSEVVIRNVANQLLENTIQIGAPSSVSVMSVQFTTDYISEYDTDESDPKVKLVRDSIKLLQNNLARLLNEKNTLAKTIDLLDKNHQVYGQNSGLSVDELTKMVNYYQNKRTEISNQINVLQEKEKKINDDIVRLNSRLDFNQSRSESISKGKLILQVMNSAAGKVDFEINYLTQSASWKPFYDLRADNIRQPIEMVYKAEIRQNSGVDWRKVNLSLSSGTPNQNNQAPLLKAWFLRFGAPMGYDQNNELLNVISGIQAEGSAMGASKTKASMSDFTTVTENQLNISFEIDVPYDILSNNKAHSVAMKDLKLPATFRYYAVPKLDKDAYLLAEISDYGKFNLLPGEANVLFEGLYVGKTFINPNETADTLMLSMGKDKKISIKREKIADRSGTKFLSNFKEQSFTYDITIRNNKKESIFLTLKDQYPLSTDEKITVELTERDGGRVNAETGIITWDFKLNAGETLKKRISYKVKYPKDMSIGNL